MRVLVCGSRTWGDGVTVRAVLRGIEETWGIETLIHGNTEGADAYAAAFAVTEPYEVEAYPADWKKHGKGAGPIRNQQMLDDGKPDQVWAFVDKPLDKSRGTADMVRRARAAGIPTYVVESIRVPVEENTNA
jgi:hypothetical protein